MECLAVRIFYLKVVPFSKLFMTHRSAIDSAIVRIYGADSIEGTGFRLGRHTVVTCAHLVNTALGRKKESAEKPTEVVSLDFPFLHLASESKENRNKPETYSAEVIGWYPMQTTDDRASDIAVLKLLQDVPMYNANVSLLPEKPFSQTRVSVCGFSKPEGRWASGNIAGPVAKGLMQLDELNHLIREGDSGAPIWNEEAECVVGMMIEVCPTDNHKQRPYAHILPSATLLSLEELSLPDGLIPPSKQQISMQRLDEFFSLIDERDHAPEVSRAVMDAIEHCKKLRFDQVCESGKPSEFEAVKRTLYRLDTPEIVAKFAQEATTQICKKNRAADFICKQMQAWCDRFQSDYNIPTPESSINTDGATQLGYLLVSLEKHPKVNKDGPYVNVFAEVHTASDAKPIPLGSHTCALNDIGTRLYDLIEQARDAIADEVTLELFLPRMYLEQDVASWRLIDEDGEEAGTLSTEQPYIIRSLDRAKKKAHQGTLQRKWKDLLSCIQDKDSYRDFHTQTTCPKSGDLKVRLRRATGLFLTAALALDPTERRGTITDIIKASVPFALWFSNTEGSSAADRQAAFDLLLQPELQTDSALLAQQWSEHRLDNRGQPGTHLKLLCDYPDRWPSLYDPDDPDDAFVAI